MIYVLLREALWTFESMQPIIMAPRVTGQWRGRKAAIHDAIRFRISSSSVKLIYDLRLFSYWNRDSCLYLTECFHIRRVMLIMKHNPAHWAHQECKPFCVLIDLQIFIPQCMYIRSALTSYTVRLYTFHSKQRESDYI